MWFQRSGAKWLMDGDMNTRYYHLKAMTRKRKNQIVMLRGANGELIENCNEVKKMVNDYYQLLFQQPPGDGVWFQTSLSYPTIDPQKLRDLDEVVGDDEVKQAIFNMGPWKAPGLDEFPAGFFFFQIFPAGFYQQAWLLVIVCVILSGMLSWILLC